MKWNIRNLIMFMFAVTICALMMAIISSMVYYGPGTVRPETASILGHLIDIMIGAVIAFVMNKNINDDNRTGV